MFHVEKDAALRFVQPLCLWPLAGKNTNLATLFWMCGLSLVRGLLRLGGSGVLKSIMRTFGLEEGV
jgi:hypothetical protein